jgi:hypothetical protein
VSHQLSHFNKSQGLMIMKWQMKNLRAAPWRCKLPRYVTGSVDSGDQSCSRPYWLLRRRRPARTPLFGLTLMQIPWIK